MTRDHRLSSDKLEKLGFKKYNVDYALLELIEFLKIKF